MSKPSSKPSSTGLMKKVGIPVATLALAGTTAALIPSCKEKVYRVWDDVRATEDRPLSRGELAVREEVEEIDSEEAIQILKDMLKAVENTRSSHDSDAVSGFDQLHECITSTAKGFGENNQMSFIIDDDAGNGVSYSLNAVDEDKITIKYRGFGSHTVDVSFTLVKHASNKTIYRQNPNNKSQKTPIKWEEMRDAIKKMIPLGTVSYTRNHQTGFYAFNGDFNQITDEV